ncbi:MAG: hypothetical protein U1E06_16220 [Tabrizicola sp.]|uniref:hypothetical protein n=1 Tax=Tabrizicola sp. TaxID=2005166 RepID=UPI0027372CD5|nr:hypothetical protein [Tabrizicola sp.]MDP3261559.1 hypothetical protein [Tabrizicola sp.]MDP3648372.1 hypothetical protein [Paracoccaceae bacterium]MDZ4068369.1 hypothetical protein [Tabrizicola sp.]
MHDRLAMPRRIVIMGVVGCGKPSGGETLATRLGLPTATVTRACRARVVDPKGSGR